MKKNFYRFLPAVLGVMVAGLYSFPAQALLSGGMADALKHVSGPKNHDPNVVKVRMNPREVKDSLRRQGFYDITFTDRTLPRYVVEACNIKRKRVRLWLNRNARIKRKTRIGNCRGRGGDLGVLDPSVINRNYRRFLRNKGYYSIRAVDRKNPPRHVEACFQGDKLSLTLRYRDRVRIRNSRRIGRCQSNKRSFNDLDILQPPEIRALLQARGFNRISFEDKVLPRYVATACRNNRKFRLKINRYGEIKSRDRISRCYQPGEFGKGPQMSFDDIRESLRARGYRRIDFTDRALPVYQATACRRGRKFNLRLNRWGEIRRRVRNGWCSTPRRFVESEPVPVVPIPRVVYNEQELFAKERISGSKCQSYLEYMLDRNRVYFATASSRINSESNDLLNRLAKVLHRCPKASVEIAGHTDSRGSYGYNQNLSERRAVSVARYLYDKGIEKSRLKPVGYGEERPVASNDTDFGMSRNRRIEFVVDWDEESEYSDSDRVEPGRFDDIGVRD